MPAALYPSVYLSIYRDRTCCGDHFRGLAGGSIVEELLCSFGELNAVLGHQYEGTLDNIAAILYSLLSRSDAAYGQRLYVVLKGGEGGLAYSIGVLGNGGDDVTGRGQLLTVLAGVICAGYGLEAVAGAAAGLAAYKHDLSIVAANVLPIGDLSLVDRCDLLYGEVGYGVVGIYDYGDAIKCEYCSGEA